MTIHNLLLLNRYIELILVRGLAYETILYYMLDSVHRVACSHPSTPIFTQSLWPRFIFPTAPGTTR